LARPWTSQPEGRNALWLTDRGWQVTAVDFSTVPLLRGSALADKHLGLDAGRLLTIEADLERWIPEAGAYDLVLVVYLHLPKQQRRLVMRAAAEAVAPGGTLLVVGHDLENLTSGQGGQRTHSCCIAPVTLCKTSSRHS
jgi:2-polyprenyl-3-methyl-5-hydroxy-6-metoxy-1,4-benzoquinol methylase